MSAQNIYLEESQLIAAELYTVIKTLESSKWRAELDTIREKLNQLQQRLQTALASLELPDFPERDEAIALLRERLQTLSALIEESRPDMDLKTAQMKSAWRAYRKSLVPEYEALAASLKLQDIHVPSLRPTNYTRNLFHVGAAVAIVLTIQHIMTMQQLMWLALGTAAMGWTMEITRRQSERVNKALMWVLGRVAHPHEHYRINSSTWYTTALLILALTATPLIGSLAVITLGVSDPSAAIIGRKFGRTKIFAGRSLEGTTAFVITGVLAGLALMSVYYPQLTFTQMILMALGGAVPGALAELYSKRIDDNLSIPLAVALGATITALFLGIHV